MMSTTLPSAATCQEGLRQLARIIAARIRSERSEEPRPASPIPASGVNQSNLLCDIAAGSGRCSEERGG